MNISRFLQMPQPPVSSMPSINESNEIIQDKNITNINGKTQKNHTVTTIDKDGNEIIENLQQNPYESSKSLGQTTIQQLKDIIADLKKIIKTENILDHEDQIRPFETDALSAYKQKPFLVLFPENTEEVSQILK